MCLMVVAVSDFNGNLMFQTRRDVENVIYTGKSVSSELLFPLDYTKAQKLGDTAALLMSLNL